MARRTASARRVSPARRQASKRGFTLLHESRSAPEAQPARGGSQRPVEVSLVLRRREPPKTPDVVSRRTPLTHEEFRARYGTSGEDLRAVKDFAKRMGLKVVRQDADYEALSGVVRVSGPLKKLARAFGLKDLRWYESQGRRFPSHAAPVFVPSKLAPLVEAVVGLDDRIPVERFAVARELRTPKRAAAPEAEVGKDVVYAAYEIARLYDYPQTRGRGQCIGVLELAGAFDEQDMKDYFKGLPRDLNYTYPHIEVVGEEWKSGKDVVSDMEVTMDTQIAGTLCNDARIVVYFPPKAVSNPGVAQLHAVLASAIYDTERRPSVLSLSWGFSENTNHLDTRPFERLLEDAARLGITVCCSSGDQGSFAPPMSSSSIGSRQWSPAVNFIASSPLALACGGTTLRAEGGEIRSEVVWNRLSEPLLIRSNGIPQATMGMATGGGVSQLFELPPYQATAQVPPLLTYEWSNGVLTQTSVFRGRGVPDVAAVADLRTGCSFFYGREWVVGGGTSASAPLWASLVLLLNENLGVKLGREVRLGWLNPLLYHLRLHEGADGLHPITEGSNGGYHASPDRPWNACTGLGSPRGRRLEAALARLLQNPPVSA